MLVLMLEVQKGCNGDVDTCISVIQTIHTIIHLSEHLNLHRTPQHNLQTKGVWIAEDALIITMT